MTHKFIDCPSLLSDLELKSFDNIEVMGRTVPSYRLASEREKRKWRVFREQLDKSERKIFDEMMSISRCIMLPEWDLVNLFYYIRFLCR